MAKYAEGTEVPTEKTLLEIKATLNRYGATGFFYGEEATMLKVGFRMNDRFAQFSVPLPGLDQFIRNGRNQVYTQEGRKEAMAKAHRQRYRALLLVIKAKLESVESGIETFEQAFMANLVLPSGQTMGEWMTPQIEEMYLSGKMPKMLMLGMGKP